jgi:hypothetical protein
MALDNVFAELRSRTQNVPRPLPLPTPEQIEAVEKEPGLSLPSDYVRFLLTASDVVLGFIEPATGANPDFRTHLTKLSPLLAPTGFQVTFSRSARTTQTSTVSLRRGESSFGPTMGQQTSHDLISQPGSSRCGLAKLHNYSFQRMRCARR